MRAPGDHERPGRPNSPWGSFVAMSAIGGAFLVILLLAPLPFRAPLDPRPDGAFEQAFKVWLGILNGSAVELANVVAAFAVLLLALFIEESIKSSDAVPVDTRRNIGLFAFVGGAVTVVITGLSVAGAAVWGTIPAAVQTLGSACVVLFFASHIATRSVVSLGKQKESLQRSLDAIEQDIARLRQHPLLRPRATAWFGGSFALANWVMLPTIGFFIASGSGQHDPAAWSAGLVGAAATATLLFFFTLGATIGNSLGIQVTAHAVWWPLALFLVLAVAVVSVLNWAGNPFLTALFLVPLVTGVLSMPLPKMGKWTLTAAARRIQLRSLVRSRRSVLRAAHELEDWERRVAVAQGSHP